MVSANGFLRIPKDCLCHLFVPLIKSKQIVPFFFFTVMLLVIYTECNASLGN